MMKKLRQIKELIRLEVECTKYCQERIGKIGEVADRMIMGEIPRPPKHLVRETIMRYVNEEVKEVDYDRVVEKKVKEVLG